MVGPSVANRQASRRPRRHGQADNRLIVTGLLAIIGVAIAMGIHTWRDPGDDSARQERAERPIRFRCERCGYEFSLIPRLFHEQWRDVNVSALPEGSRHKAHCPHCQERYCAAIIENRLSDEERRHAVSVLPNRAQSRP